MKNKCFIIAFAIISFFILSLDAHTEEIPANISNLDPVGLKVTNLRGGTNLNFIWRVEQVRDFGGIIDTKVKSKKLLEYFFVCLSQPDQKFWVNLHPRQPDRIIDPELGSTDVGRILLKSDLRLKKDAAALTNPQASKIGRQFWDALYERARKLNTTDNIKVPAQMRLWIVPEEVVIFRQADEVYIVESGLKVLLESEYLPQRSRVKDRVQRKLEKYCAELIQKLIIPELNQRVNNDPYYKPLRDVYMSLILSRWYKQRFSSDPRSLLQTVDARIFKDLNLDFKADPKAIFEEYLGSLLHGEYNFEENQEESNRFFRRWIRKRYFGGGIDLRESRYRVVPQDSRKEAPQGPGRPNAPLEVLTCVVTIPGSKRDNPLQYARAYLQLTPFEDAPPVVLPAINPEPSIREAVQKKASFIVRIAEMVSLILSRL